MQTHTVRLPRAWWLILAFISGFSLATLAEDLILDWHANRLEFSAPRVHFLVGKPLEHLRNAAEVPFDIQITLSSGNKTHVLRRAAERFIVSYDLWEESFSVLKVQTPRKSVSHLKAPAAEAWCLEQMPMDVGGLPGGEQLWVRLEIRAQEAARNNPPLFGRGNIGESGVSLTSLVEIFSRPASTSQPHWILDAGPVTLDEIKRSRSHGS